MGGLPVRRFRVARSNGSNEWTPQTLQLFAQQVQELSAAVNMAAPQVDAAGALDRLLAEARKAGNQAQLVAPSAGFAWPPPQLPTITMDNMLAMYPAVGV